MGGFDYRWGGEYGDGMRVRFGFMKEGMWYWKEVGLKGGVGEKKVRLKWEVLGEGLGGGREERWRMEILDGGGKGVDGGVVGRLYDG